MIDRLRLMTADTAATLEGVDAAEYPGVDLHVRAWHESARILEELQTGDDDVRASDQLPDVVATVEGFREAMHAGDIESALERSAPALRALNGVFAPNDRYITSLSELPGPIKRRRRLHER